MSASQCGTQRYAVLQPIYERAIEDDKARIQAEANQARSEKAKGNTNATGSNQYAKKDKVDSGGTTCAVTEQKKDSRPGQDSAAAATGTNRGDVQRWTQIQNLCAELHMPEIAEQVIAGELPVSAESD